MAISSVINLFFKGQMEYAMRIIIPIGEQIFCSWLFHELVFIFLVMKGVIYLKDFNEIVSPPNHSLLLIICYQWTECTSD